MIPGALLLTAHPVLAGVDLNPLDWISALRYPVGWLIEMLSIGFNAVGPLRAIGPFGLAIVVATLIIRAVLYPVFRWNIRTQRRVQREQRLVGPAINEVRKRFRGDGRRINEEVQKVYAEHGMSIWSPMAGCLPLLVQLPVLYGLYWGIRDVAGINKPATVTFDVLPHGIGLNFLWIHDVSLNIGQQVANCHASATSCVVNWANLFQQPSNLLLLVVPAITGLAYFVQSKMTMQPLRADMSEQERQMASSMRTIVYFMPLMSVFFCFIWPQGLSLYWATAALVMIGQQFSLMGWGAMRVPPWFPGAARVTPLSFQQDLAALGGGSASRSLATGVAQNGHRRTGRGAPSALQAPKVAGSPGTGRTPSRAQRKARRRR